MGGRGEEEVYGAVGKERRRVCILYIVYLNEYIGVTCMHIIYTYILYAYVIYVDFKVIDYFVYVASA